MTTFLKKYSSLISILLVLTLVVCTWLFPLAGIILALILLLFSLVLMTYSIVEKHRKTYLKGEITKLIFLRNSVLEVILMLLVMLLAALLGNYIAHFATQQITNDLTKFVAGVIIGLLVGIGVGILIKRAWEKVQLLSRKWNSSKNTI